MGVKDPRVDAYIAGAAQFARPILREIRRRVHAANPDVVETLKWSAPHFEYAGKLYCGMSAFKQHCAFGFWHPLMRERDRSLEGMGQFGKITSLADLPAAREFAKLARRAKGLTDTGAKAPPRPKVAKKPVVVPADFRAALAKNRKAATTFVDFSPSHRREYIEWITEAKRAETRQARIEQAIAQLAEGKSRHWKYLK
jgi:uncharacterized protein YdeI (YjbR/CyaY-like superfamily)